MASGGKRKTTMAKLNRERKLRERRLEKQAKKAARKQAAADARADSAQPDQQLSDGDTVASSRDADGDGREPGFDRPDGADSAEPTRS
jgi:hypothetical protein